jgi:hypothetical protein
MKIMYDDDSLLLRSTTLRAKLPNSSTFSQNVECRIDQILRQLV